jgi:hypothetical protein
VPADLRVRLMVHELSGAEWDAVRRFAGKTA